MYHRLEASVDYVPIQTMPCQKKAQLSSQQLLKLDERNILSGNLVLLVVSCMMNIPRKALLQANRGAAEISLARQTAMYLMHTVLSRPYHDVADYFSRDRTTVSHACRLVEDLRDDSEYEKQIIQMEELLTTSRALSDLANTEIVEVN